MYLTYIAGIKLYGGLSMRPW